MIKTHVAVSNQLHTSQGQKAKMV